MKKILLWILAIVVILGAIAAFLFRPASYHVERSVAIEVSAEEAFAKVHDFNEWPKWSPWLVMEPEAKVNVTGDGKSVGDAYAWSGELVGKGELRHDAVEIPKSTDMTITFFEPMAGSAKVGFRVEPDAQNSGVSKATWMMDGKIPWIMKSMMAAWIGMDYDRGLGMLKEYCETGDVVTKTEVGGTVDRPAVKFVGVEGECTIEGISDAMGESFEALEAALNSAGIEPSDHYLATYSKFELVKNQVVYTAACQVDEKPENLPEGLIFGEIPAHSAFTVAHIGPFRNLGNGWSTGMQHIPHEKNGPKPQSEALRNVSARFGKRAGSRVADGHLLPAQVAHLHLPELAAMAIIR